MKRAILIIFCAVTVPTASSAKTFLSYPVPSPQLYDETEVSPSGEVSHPLPFITKNLPEIRGRSSCECVRDLSILRRPEVRKALYSYLADGRDYTGRGIFRAALFRDDVDRIFTSNPSIPKEIVVLPILESGYSPVAVSRMQAVGTWQIIAPTAKSLGLTINQWIDERRDVRKSTAAALTHLQFLYDYYGHWDFALAAYNGGSPRVSKAIEKNKTRDYWTLVEKNAFRPETNSYVPQFAALAVIYFNRDLFGFTEPEPESEPFEGITLEYPVRLDELARIAGTDKGTVQRMNPEITGTITPPDRDHYTVRLPVGSADRIMGRENELYRYKVSRIARHLVRKGESVGKIAKSYGVDPGAIIYLNGMSKPYYLRAGKEIYIPKG